MSELENLCWNARFRQRCMNLLGQMSLHQVMNCPLTEHWLWQRRVDFKDQELRRRTELTLAIGEQAQDRCRYSRLWHPFQNTWTRFRGAMYDSMSNSFLGQVEGDELIVLTTGIKRKLPNITTLQLMVDFSSMNEMIITDTVLALDQLLIGIYAPNLVTFKLWAYIPPIDQYSTLKTFLLRLWRLLERMTNLRTLWLDITEVPLNPDLAACVQYEVTLDWELPNLNAFRNMHLLEEFRFFSWSSRLVYAVELPVRMGYIPSLQRISFLYPDSFQELAAYEVNTAQRLYNIGATLGPPALGQLAQFFDHFNVLQRIDAYLVVGGPRFLELFRGLHQLAHLRVLNVIVNQPALFAMEDLLGWIRPLPLTTLVTLHIRMNIVMSNCSAISVAPLFQPTELERARQQKLYLPLHQAQLHQPMPQLRCFEMVVQEGCCTAENCERPEEEPRVDVCAQRAVTCWFLQIPHIGIVKYRNLNHHHLQAEQIIRAMQPAPDQRWPRQFDLNHHVHFDEDLDRDVELGRRLNHTHERNVIHEQNRIHARVPYPADYPAHDPDRFPIPDDNFDLDLDDDDDDNDRFQ